MGPMETIEMYYGHMDYGIWWQQQPPAAEGRTFLKILHTMALFSAIKVYGHYDHHCSNGPSIYLSEPGWQMPPAPPQMISLPVNQVYYKGQWRI